MRWSAIRHPGRRSVATGLGLLLLAVTAPAQQMVTEGRDPQQVQDEDFAKVYDEWTSDPRFGSPLVDHLPRVAGVPTPRDVLGYHIGAPRKLTYYADMLKYYRALAAATPRVHVEGIGRSDEGRELVVVWISSDENIRALSQNRANLRSLADPRTLTPDDVRRLITATKPHYHLMGGLHSSETGSSEMLMELVYRLATETSPLVTQIRNNVYVSVTPAADADGRDRNVDWFYRGLDAGTTENQGTVNSGTTVSSETTVAQGTTGTSGTPAVPYWGKYVHHDNNRDINLSLVQVRALADWYFTAHPPIIHDLHESQTLLYTYSGGPPQNPNLDPLLFAELPWFANWELAQMTKWGMPGVYTHAFMDGWSPGYVGSLAYNHNGMMRMYETQSGRDTRAGMTGATGTAGRSGQPQAGAPTPTSAPAPSSAAGAQATGGRAGGRAAAVPTGRGGSQEREWYRGIPAPPNAAATFTRRNNTNYMQTGVLSALQLASMFPNVVVENFYVKTRNSIEDGRTKAPHAFVIPVQRDMTSPAMLVNILRAQGIEVGQTESATKIGEATIATGSYVVKLDQPYGRLAKNLLERQIFPDPRLTTYDDSGWTMGLSMGVEVKEIADKAILSVTTTPVTKAQPKGKLWPGNFTCDGNISVAVAHYGSNNMITFRYRLKSVPMRVAEKAFTAGGTQAIPMPAGSLVFDFDYENRNPTVDEAIEDLGLTAAHSCGWPNVPMHDADVPRLAIYSQWTNTQDLGWYRLTFDNFQIPYDLIYKERVAKGSLKADYDVIVMAAQQINRQTVLQPPAARAVPYLKTDKYQFLGMYGETPDMTGGFGQEGVDAFAKFLEDGGTLIAAGSAVRFPIEFGWAHTVDTEAVTGLAAPRPLVQAEITRPDHPVFYGYQGKTLTVKYINGSPILRVGVADQENVLGRYTGGDSAVLSGLMVGADQLRQRPLAVDIPNAHNGRGRVVLFANNPIYRWQNHGEFNMVFNSLLNWNDAASPSPRPGTPARSGGAGGSTSAPPPASRR